MAMNTLQQRFLNLSNRQQVLWVSGLLCLLVVLVYFSFWRTITDEGEQLDKQYAVAMERLQKVELLAEEYKVLNKVRPGKGAASRSNLSRIADISAANNQLLIKRYQPTANGGAQLRFENVVLENVIGWLYEMEAVHNISLQDISITNGREESLVNVSVRLSQPS